MARVMGRRGGRGGPGALEPGLGLGDIDLDAVGPLAGRALAEGRCPLGCRQTPPGLLALSVRQVQRLLSGDGKFPFGGLLWYWRGDLSFLLKSITSQNWGSQRSPAVPPAHSPAPTRCRRDPARGGPAAPAPRSPGGSVYTRGHPSCTCAWDAALVLKLY